MRIKISPAYNESNISYTFVGNSIFALTDDLEVEFDLSVLVENGDLIERKNIDHELLPSNPIRQAYKENDEVYVVLRFYYNDETVPDWALNPDWMEVLDFESFQSEINGEESEHSTT